MKSLTLLENELAKNKVSCDLKLENSIKPNSIMDSYLQEHGILEKIIDLYLQHSKELSDKIKVESDQDELKCQRVLRLTALEFCISSLVRESTKIGKQIKELVQWENPSL